MTATGDSALGLDYRTILDNMGAGVLIFNDQDRLIVDNVASRRLLGANLVLIRSEGWKAFTLLVDGISSGGLNGNEIRQRAQRDDKPVRFSLLLSGIYMPCWMAGFSNEKGKHFTQVVIDNPDWTALTELMSTFRAEARSAINDTKGHAQFVRDLLNNPPAKLSAAQLGKNAMGMVNLISNEMHHLQLLVDLLHRLEVIRTGQLLAIIEESQRKINVEDFLEDFLEELSDEALIDPTVKADQYRDRLKLDIDDNLYMMAPKSFLRHILRDVLRNAFMYSEPETPVKVRVSSATGGRHIQIDITNEGCGIRTREAERVFTPFERGRQPQVLREHGYGLSLYLAKAEVEAIGGRMWYESEEGVQTTFSFKLPAFKKA